MAKYSVSIKRSAQKEIRAHPTERARCAIVAVILALADDPRPDGCVKLTGAEKYRVRKGVYRVLYTIDDHSVLVTVVRVAHRSSAYY